MTASMYIHQSPKNYADFKITAIEGVNADMHIQKKTTEKQYHVNSKKKEGAIREKDVSISMYGEEEQTHNSRIHKGNRNMQDMKTYNHKDQIFTCGSRKIIRGKIFKICNTTMG